mgnify:FL=1
MSDIPISDAYILANRPISQIDSVQITDNNASIDTLTLVNMKSCHRHNSIFGCQALRYRYSQYQTISSGFSFERAFCCPFSFYNILV